MKFELFVAARYLRAKRRQAVISLITAISVLGVAAGVASLIIALAIVALLVVLGVLAVTTDAFDWRLVPKPR